MLKQIKMRCGIAAAVTVYDADINLYIEDCKNDLLASGVKQGVIESENASVITAITFYVKALLGNDRTDTDKYMSLYRDKAFRLSLEEEPEVAPVQPDTEDDECVEQVD